MEGLAQDPPQHSYATHEHVNGDANGRPDPKYFRTSPSLTPPEPSEPDSDFGIEEAGAEAVHSRPGSSEDEASDDSTYGAARRKRQKQQAVRPAKRIRPETDNERTRTLRSAQPSEEPSLQNGNGFAHSFGQDQTSDIAAEEESDVEEQESQPMVVDRQLSAEEHAQQLQQVRCSWQLAAVLEFLHVFSIHLQLRDSFTPEELEVAIVADTGQNGLLANLHQDLLRGITSRTDLNSHNWAAHFANRLKYQWVSTHLRGSPPFAPMKRQEALDYAALHATDRVLALKLLCEIRLDKDDLRAAVELAMKPPKAPSRPPLGKSTRSGGPNRGRAEAAQEQQLELHHEALGEDGDDVMWWYLDMGHATQTGPSGSRLYKEMPSQSPPHPNPTPSKASRGKDPKGKGTTGKGAKGRGKKAKGNQGGSLVGPPAVSAWELVASNTEELQAVGEELVSSSVKGQSDIGYQILDQVVPTLIARAEALEKRAKAAAKIAAQLNNVVPDDNGHYGRSRRQRTQVNYNYDEYDRTIKDAIKGGRNEIWPAPTRPQRDFSRLPLVESRRAGLRGGKPLDAPQASPDENRPSNDQSGAEDFQERADSEDDEASEQQAATSDASNGANVHGAYETGMHGAGQSDQPTHFSQLYQPSMPSQSMQSSWPASNGSSLTYPLHT